MILSWCSFALGAPDHSAVDYSDEADLQFRLGLAAYDKHDFNGALAHLLESNRLVPNRNVVYNVARTYEQLGDVNAAWRYYDRYVQAELDSTARADAEEALSRLTPKVARVRVSSVPAGATVYVEREDLGPRGQTPLTLALPAGPHDVLVEADGYAPRSQKVDLAVGTLADLALSLVPRGSTVPTPDLGGWQSTTVRAGNLVLVSVMPGQCHILPDRAADLGQYVEPLIPMPSARGSALATATGAVGLSVELVVGGTGEARDSRMTLVPVSKRSLVLQDAGVLHESVFDRCVPTNGEDLTTALAGLPEAVRLDAMRLFGEWAAWKGAPDAAIVADMCRSGTCPSLADRLTH